MTGHLVGILVNKSLLIRFTDQVHLVLSGLSFKRNVVPHYYTAQGTILNSL